MRLADLARAAGWVSDEAGDINVTGFAIDNRKVAPGNVFGAFVGASAMARISSPPPSPRVRWPWWRRPEAKVEGAIHIADANPRRAFARLAARFTRRCPTMVAVTGTNGKTSTVEMTRQIWRMAGDPPPASARWGHHAR
jgi:UDP-N-acetylmuramoyl-L-alanyl-D-glutamate--2,6-diaminopimelate ligase